MSRYAHVLGLLDKPCDRSSHTRLTPKGGGIGLLCVFVVVCLYVQLPVPFWFPVTILSLLSLFDDRVELSPKLRLAVQFAAAGIVLIGLDGERLNLLSVSGSGGNIFLVLLLTTFFVVYITGTANFFNFMDGINGIAGISGIVAFGLLGCFGIITGQNLSHVVLSLALASACAGFLPFNMPKARVFMGDVGSILLGFVFACLVVVFSASVVDLLILSSFLFPFYLDELTSMAERLRKRQSLTEPHRSHLYQVLANEAGIAHWKVSLGYGVAQLIIGVSIWGALKIDLYLGILLLISFASAFVLLNNRVKSVYMEN